MRKIIFGFFIFLLVFSGCGNPSNGGNGGNGIPDGPDAISLLITNTRTMNIGEQWKPGVTVLPAGAPIISWTSDNTAVATVANDGTITARAIGSARITATAKGGLNSSCTITVQLVLSQATHPNFGGDNLNCIVFGGDKFLVGDSEGNIYHSVNGISWTLEATNVLESNDGIYALAYGNGTYIAGGGFGRARIAKSSDGITWELVSKDILISFSNITSIAYENGIFVAGSFWGRIAWSEDGGQTWTPAHDGERIFDITGGTVNNIIYADGKFVAAGRGQDQHRIAYSTNGKDWTRVTIPFAENYGWSSVAYGGGLFISGFDSYDNTVKFASSQDALTWTPISITSNNPFSVGYPQNMIYAKGNFFASVTGMGFINLTFSSNGTTWINHSTIGPNILRISAMAFGKDRLVFTGISDYVRQIWYTDL